MALTPEQSDRKHSREAIAQALGVQFKGRQCKCPFHPDKNASAGIFIADDGWKFKCLGCNWTGDVFDIEAYRTSRSVDEVLASYRITAEPQPPSRPLRQIIDYYPNVENIYKYTHPETRKVELVVIRYHPEGEDKRFAQVTPQGGGWATKGLPTNPLYNRTRVSGADTVVVCEGEKSVHAFTDIGIVATTSPMGSLSAGKADWSPLKGKKIFIWPDNDANGERYAADVRMLLEPLTRNILQVDVKNLDLGEKEDIVEYLKANPGSPEEQKMIVELVLRDSEPTGPKHELMERAEKIYSGQWINIEWPWYEMSWQAQALVPESVTAICGDPGCGKSFMMLEAFTHWHLAGHQVSLFMLEDNRAYHMNRVLAQLEGNSLLTNLTWVNEHPREMKQAIEMQGDIIQSFGLRMSTSPKGMATHTKLLDWFESQCKEGSTICGIDPITAAQVSDKPWIDDQKFIFRAQDIAEQYHSRLIYTIHPRVSQGKVGPSLSRMAGGAAYSRFSHSVFWISKFETPQENEVYASDTGKIVVSHERAIRISKARNGPGAGLQIALNLNPNTLRFIEHGTIITPARQLSESHRN